MKPIESCTLAELIALQADVAAHIDKRRQEEKAAVLERLKAVAAEAGFALEDLVRGASGRAAVKPKAADRRSVVAPKYRDPATGDTWTGRGKKPKWVAAALAGGKTLNDLTI